MSYKNIAAMKANELMQGDIILYEYDGQKFPARVIEIYRNSVLVESINGEYEPIEIEEDKIFPVALTQEILEKNGWKDISTHTLKGCDTFRLCLEQRSFDYTLTLKMRDYFRLDSYDDRVYTLCQVNFGFKYVHELQHALSLCGIEKNIEL